MSRRRRDPSACGSSVAAQCCSSDFAGGDGVLRERLSQQVFVEANCC
jgi:hypothetical protein